MRVLDNFSSGKIVHLKDCIAQLELVQADIRDSRAVAAATRGVEYILHQAAVASVSYSVADPKTTSEVNVNGTLNLLESARSAGVKRFVFASSCAIYGDDPTLPKREDSAALPLSPYAASKLAGELYCQTFYRVYGLETVCLRYFNVFGPNQDPASQYAAVIPKFIAAFLNQETPTIYGDGEQSRDFLHVENVVRANLLACQAPGAAGRVFNVGSGRAVSINDLLRILAAILGRDVSPTYAGERPGDIRHSLADISLARELLGYQPVVGLEEGLARTVEWYRQELVKPEGCGT